MDNGIGNYRKRLWAWLPPMLYDVLGEPPSRELLRWLWGIDYDSAALTETEGALILVCSLGDVGPSPAPGALRKRLRHTQAVALRLSPSEADLVARAAESMERDGFITQQAIDDSDFEELYQWLETNNM